MPVFVSEDPSCPLLKLEVRYNEDKDCYVAMNGTEYNPKSTLVLGMYFEDIDGDQISEYWLLTREEANRLSDFLQQFLRDSVNAEQTE